MQKLIDKAQDATIDRNSDSIARNKEEIENIKRGGRNA